MTISNIVVNGHTYTDADWRADWEGTISAVANDIAAAIGGAAIVGGTLFKALSGSVTLSTSESNDNRVFVFTGALAADATVTFDPAFQGLATIINNTTGGFGVIVKLAAGTGVTIANGSTALVYCDGTNFSFAVGILSTSTGSSVNGTLSVSGNTTISGSATISGGLHLDNDIQVNGDGSFNGDMHIGGGFEVFGVTALHGDVNIEGDINSTGEFSSDTLLAASGCTITGANRAFQVAAALGEIRGALSAPSGQACWWMTETAGTPVWLFGKNTSAQAGSNTGADFDIVACSDGGTPTGTPFRIYRDTREVNMPLLPTSSAGLRSGSLWNNAGVVSVA